MEDISKNKKVLAAVGIAGGALIVTGIVLLNKKPPVPGTEIILSSLNITPKSVYPGEKIEVSVMVHNKGAVIYVATIDMVAEEDIMMETVTLEPGEKKTIEFDFIAPEKIGVLHISVGDLKGVVMVMNPEPETAILTGKVTDSETGLAVDGATVAVIGWGTTTDAIGYYWLEGIQPVGQTFEVAVIAEGYEILRVQHLIGEGETILDLAITPLPPPPPEKLVFTATGIGAGLWSGDLIDVATGKRQWWGVQRVEQRIEMEPPSGNLVRFRYFTNYGDSVHGWFLIDLPSTSGEFVWNGANYSFDGAQVIDMTRTPNRSFIKGKLVMQDYYNGAIKVKVSESEPVGDFNNYGQYFIGETLTMYGNIPLNEWGGFALNVGGSVEVRYGTLLQKSFNIPGGSISVGVWVFGSLNNL